MLSIAGWAGSVIHDASGDLFTVDLDDGMELSYVGAADAVMLDMAFSPAGELYGVAGDYLGGSGPSGLYSFVVDFESPSPTIETNFLGHISLGEDRGITVNSLQFRDDGELYAAGFDDYGYYALFRIDPGTAGAERKLDLEGHESAGDLAFDYAGNAYLTTTWGDLLRIDPGMDSFDVVGPTDYWDFYGLLSGPSPLIYGFREVREVYRVDPDTAQTTLVAQLAHPQLDFIYGAATVFRPPTDLGEVDFRELIGQQPILGQLWYRVVATSDAVLTVDLANADPSADIDVTLYRFDRNGDLDQLQTDRLRLDYEDTVPGQEYFVKIEGAESALDVRVANLVRPAGNGAIVYGTEGNDTFEFAPGPPYTIRINGVNYPYNFGSGDVVTVTFHGDVGHDVARITGSTRADVVNLSLATFSGTAASPGYYQVTVTGTPEMSFAGAGGNDVATLIGSAAADTITLRPGSARVGGVNSALDVTEVNTIDVDAGAESDTAAFHGTGADETVDLQYRQADFGGEGFSIRLSDAESVTAHAGGGYDTATLSDSPDPDRFEAYPTWATMTGPGLFLAASGFDEVRAHSSPGEYDVAELFDDPNGEDTLETTPTYGELSGSGFFNRVEAFRYTHAYSSVGNQDVAKMYGSHENDTLVARPEETTLSGAPFYSRAVGFRYVHAVSSGGADVAKLYD
ncbi:MAG: NHL repeat-containing protein, partial [Planctomycetota bacterium]